MSVIFIAGTDTGVGKTVITGLLSRYLLKKKYRVATQKWIETGTGHYSFDALSTPYVFRFPASPHLAARLEGRPIDIAKIKNSFRALSRDSDFVVIEGIGGILIPINNKTLLIDIVKELKLPVLIVAANKLGAINHTLLTIEALKARKMKIIGMIFNCVLRNEDEIILEDNPKVIGKISGEKVLGILPWARDRRRLQNRFESIGDRILARL